MAAIHVEQDDDEAQEVTGEVGASKHPGEAPCTMLPSCHLKDDRPEDMRLRFHPQSHNVTTEY